MPDPCSVSQADVNLPAAHVDLDRREPHAGIAWMAAGLEVELEAVPRAHDVPLGLGKMHAGAAHVGRERLFDLVKNLPLAHRPARVRAHVLVGEDLVAEA